MWGDVVSLLVLGAMIFFPLVVAPTVFQALPADAAGTFLRKLFPRYYLFMIIGTAVAAALYLSSSLFDTVLLAAVSASTAWVLLILMPRINRYRDRELAGDADAGAAFKQAHRQSVLINVVQLGMIAVAVAT
jgi:hypothetical protein